MASKENQEALDLISKKWEYVPDDCYEALEYERNILQKAIDDLEIKDKALKLFIKDMKDDCFVKFVCTNTDCNECIENKYLTLARKELENGK